MGGEGREGERESGRKEKERGWEDGKRMERGRMDGGGKDK